MDEPTFLIFHSAEIDKIAEAFVEAQKNFGTITRDKKADIKTLRGQYSYTYSDLGAALDAVLPALHGQGIGVLQSPGNLVADGITVETRLMHKSAQFLGSQLTMKPTSTDPQGSGSAITYVRRYALMAMCGLAAVDDDGAAASKPPASGRARRSGQAAAVPPAGNNTLLLRAVELGVIPAADRLMFKAWARENVQGCANLEDAAPLTALHVAALEKVLDAVAEAGESPVGPEPAAPKTDVERLSALSGAELSKGLKAFGKDNGLDEGEVNDVVADCGGWGKAKANVEKIVAKLREVAPAS